MPILDPSPDALASAARLIQSGGLVGLPTETVYGLAADATNGEAVAAIYARKGRPRFNPLIVHVGCAERAWERAAPTAMAEMLAARFWPGPLTMVLPARSDNGIADLATAGLDTIAVRVPDHPVARALIAASGRPLAAPSANRSGRISPTTAADVVAELGDDLPVLDGGPCFRGLESTIVAFGPSGVVLLRAGSIPAAEIEAACGAPLTRMDGTTGASSAPIAPGQLQSHYAPRAMVRLRVSDWRPGEALLAFGPTWPRLDARATNGSVSDLPASDLAMSNLSPTGDVAEAARNLFGALRRLDASGAHTIAVMSIPDVGLGEAINDRLERAAANRSSGGPSWG
ncbi:MAG: L-threonylcarbamoyladenylate synthase [Hyphomicrobium aestuarii]|nr:L-threonylcarbamoyladenylate synthase [Hyphomicrobium aestuarii]